MRILREILRFSFVGLSLVMFSLLFYLSLIGLRPGQGQEPPHGLIQWVVATSECALISGLLPLVVAVVWAFRVHTLKGFWRGAIIVVGILCFHHVLSAVDAHSERGYRQIYLDGQISRW